MTDSELADYVKRGRRRIGSVGPMHAYWDTISDAEAILAGKRSLLERDVIERLLREWLNDPGVR